MSFRTSNSNNVTFDCHKTLADVLNFFNNGNIRDCRALIRSLKHNDIVILGSFAQSIISKAAKIKKTMLSYSYCYRHL